jgi:hypothetical protein
MDITSWDDHDILKNHVYTGPTYYMRGDEDINSIWEWFPVEVGEVSVVTNVLQPKESVVVEYPIANHATFVEIVGGVDGMMPSAANQVKNISQNIYSGGERYFQEEKPLSEQKLPDTFKHIYSKLKMIFSPEDEIWVGGVFSLAIFGFYLSQFIHADFTFHKESPSGKEGVSWIIFFGVQENSFIWVWRNKILQRVHIPYLGMVIIRSDTFHAGYIHSANNYRVYFVVKPDKYFGEKKQYYRRDIALQPCVLEAICNRAVRCNDFVLHSNSFDPDAFVDIDVIKLFLQKRQTLVLEMNQCSDECSEYSGRSIDEYPENSCEVLVLKPSKADLEERIKELELDLYRQFTQDEGILKRKQSVQEKRFWNDYKGKFIMKDEIFQNDESARQELKMRFKYFKNNQKINKSSSFSSNIVVEKFNISMTTKNLNCLLNGEVINDDVLNFYFSLIDEKAIAIRKYYKYFETSFMDKLLMDSGTYDFDNVKR